MREKGVEYPEPNFNGAGRAINKSQINTHNPHYVSAVRICREVFR
jgi:hypothetical protein